MTQDESGSGELTGDEARARLADAARLGAATARRGAPTAAIMTGGVGLLVAAALAAIRLTLPDHPAAFVVSFVAYGLALTALIVWQLRTQVVAQRGFGRAYRRGFAATIVLYVSGVALVTRAAELSWPVFAGYCVLVALPMLITAVRLLIGGGRPVGSRA